MHLVNERQTHPSRSIKPEVYEEGTEWKPLRGVSMAGRVSQLPAPLRYSSRSSVDKVWRGSISSGSENIRAESSRRELSVPGGVGTATLSGPQLEIEVSPDESLDTLEKSEVCHELLVLPPRPIGGT